MIPAFITVFLWSYCVIASRRSLEQLGENAANAARIVVALAVLGGIAHVFGMGLGGGGLFFFFLSGVVGFGMGDIGIFHALPRIGSRLTLLMAQCLAAPIAGVAEWFWLGTTISFPQILAIAVILIGILIAIAPKNLPATSLKSFSIGIVFGLMAGVGQGLGAVLSRKAYEAAHTAGSWTEAQGIGDSILMGATSGYQRLIGGTLVIVSFYFISLIVPAWRTRPRAAFAGDSRSWKAMFVLLTAASGPIFGIIFFQWALATTPSAIVQPIIAMTPLVVMPMSRYLEGDRPSVRAIVGALVSVFGVILLVIL